MVTQSRISEKISERLLAAIRRDIVQGDLAPGSRLRVDELSKRYGTSHIPVREALLQLAGERLVTIEPNKGAVLRAVTPKFVADIHDSRGAIEGLLIRRATEKITDLELEELNRLCEVHANAARIGNGSSLSDANKAFHRHIATVADNPEAAYILDQGWDLVISLRQRFEQTSDRISQIVDEHRAIVAAVVERDVDDAVRAIQIHCDSARDHLLNSMRSQI